MSQIRVLLVEDHDVVREGLRLVLGRHPDLVVAADAANASDAVAAVELERPDVVVMDIALGADDGVTLIDVLLRRAPETRILVLTMFDDAETVRQCLFAGAAGYIVKGATSTELVTAIRAVAGGERYLHSSVVGSVIEDSLRLARGGQPLSRREYEVLSLLGGGRRPAIIGEILGISVHTVRRHMSSAAAKLDARGAAALALYAQEQGFARAVTPSRGSGEARLRGGTS